MKKKRDSVGFSRDGLTTLLELSNLTAYNIFLFLSEEMDRENKLTVSQQTLAETLGVTRQSINTGVKELVEKKLIQLLKVGNSVTYYLNTNVVLRFDCQEKS